MIKIKLQIQFDCILLFPKSLLCSLTYSFAIIQSPHEYKANPSKKEELFAKNIIGFVLQQSIVRSESMHLQIKDMILIFLKLRR